MNAISAWPAVFAGGTCCLAGVLVALALRPSTPSQVSAPPPDGAGSHDASPATGTLDRAALEALTREVQALRLQLSAQRAPVASTTSDSDVDDLGAVLREMRELLRQRPAADGAARGFELDTTSRGALRPTLFARRDDVDLSEEFDERHKLWSYQRVVDAYGVPDQVSSNGSGMSWIYTDEASGHETFFEFTDGFVTGADFQR